MIIRHISAITLVASALIFGCSTEMNKEQVNEATLRFQARAVLLGSPYNNGRINEDMLPVEAGGSALCAKEAELAAAWTYDGASVEPLRQHITEHGACNAAIAEVLANSAH